MGRGRKDQAQKCATVARHIIQSAELACYGSLKLCHTSCQTGTSQKPRIYTQDKINHYIDIIAKNSNCTASLERLDNKKVPPCQVMPIELYQQYKYNPYKKS